MAGTSADGRHPQVWIGCGPNAWEWCKRNAESRILTLLPPGERPEGFDWRLLAGCGPLMMVCCGQVAETEIRALVAALVRAGVERIIVGGGSRITIYVRERAR